MELNKIWKATLDEMGKIVVTMEMGLKLIFKIDHDEAILIDHQCVEGLRDYRLVIPEGIEWERKCYAVTELGDWCLSMARASEIVLPSSLKRLGKFTLHGDSTLAKLTIPEAVESIGIIGVGIEEIENLSPNFVMEGEMMLTKDRRKIVYMPQDMVEVVMPDTVEVMEESQFAKMRQLRRVVINNGIEHIAKLAFDKCVALEEVVIPESVNIIKDMAFYGCSGLRRLVIPDTVIGIDDSVFEGCTGLEEIKLSKNLQYIGMAAFSGDCKLEEVVLPDEIYTIDEQTFMGCTGLKRIEIPANIEDIGVEAFAGCTALESVTLHKGIEGIGFKAFSGCKGLKEITIPETIKFIGNYAFDQCEGLTKVWIKNKDVELDTSPNIKEYRIAEYCEDYYDGDSMFPPHAEIKWGME